MATRLRSGACDLTGDLIEIVSIEKRMTKLGAKLSIHRPRPEVAVVSGSRGGSIVKAIWRSRTCSRCLSEEWTQSLRYVGQIKFDRLSTALPVRSSWWLSRLRSALRATRLKLGDGHPF